MSGAKRSSKRLMMIVRVPTRQKPSRNGRNDPYTPLNLNIVKDYIVITDVHQNPNFSPRIREKKLNFEGLLWGRKTWALAVGLSTIFYQQCVRGKEIIGKPHN